MPHHNCINTENTEQACFLYQVYEECCGNDKNAIVPIISLWTIKIIWFILL